MALAVLLLTVSCAPPGYTETALWEPDGSVHFYDLADGSLCRSDGRADLDVTLVPRDDELPTLRIRIVERGIESSSGPETIRLTPPGEVTRQTFGTPFDADVDLLLDGARVFPATDGSELVTAYYTALGRNRSGTTFGMTFMDGSELHAEVWDLN